MQVRIYARNQAALLNAKRLTARAIHEVSPALTACLELPSFTRTV